MSESKPPRLGKYELIARLATGGMAEIFLARQPGPRTFSRLVVVKRILPHLAERQHFLDMFLEEARLASLVRHQNVVQIYDVGQQDDSFFIAMEYIDGLTVGALARRARKHKVLVPYAVVGELISQACDGLHIAHELRNEEDEPIGLVHRDISPQNLMIARSGEVKLVDFGIAKAQGSEIKTRTGAIKGKFPYMSPEQCSGLQLDRRSDIFSLASVAIELLVGKRIFDRPSELMTLKAITEEPIPAACALHREVPEPISAIITRAHARDPDDRYETAAQMSEAMRTALEVTGHTTTKKLLANYLTNDCEELVEARSSSVSRLGALSSFTSSVPKLDGFDESTSADELEPTRVDRGKYSIETHEQAKVAEGGEPAGEPGDAPPREPKPRRRWPIALGASIFVGALAAVAILFFALPSRPSGPALTFACPPYYDTDAVKTGLQPLARYLEDRLDRRVEVVVTKDYDALRERLLAGDVDFANVSPLLFVRTRHQNENVKVLVAHTYEGARTYQSYLVAEVNSGIRSIQDLRGKTFCYVDRGSTSGYLLPRSYMRAEGLDPDDFFGDVRLSGSHVSVMEDILAGRCDAGAIFSGALLSAQELGVPTSRVNLVSVVGATPWDVVCGSPQLPQTVADGLTKALLEFDPQTHLGRKIVSPTFRIDGFVEARVEDFDVIENAARAENLLE